MTGSVSTDASATPGWHALRTVPLLASLTDRQGERLWLSSLARRYDVGQVLRRVGDPASHLLLLLDGRVSVTVAARSGQVVRFGEYAGPCAMDKVAVIDGKGHTATLTALTACSVRSVPRADFLALVDDVASVRRHVLGILAGQARRHQQRHLASATLPAEARLASWLLAQAARTTDGVVALPGTQHTLAESLGVTRVTVSRALGRLRRDGLIDVRRGHVTLLAPELLHLRTVR